MNSRRYLNGLLMFHSLCLMIAAENSTASQVSYHWPNAPLELDLAVGYEQRISVPEARSLRLGIPQSVKPILRTEIVGNHLWLEAKEPFNPVRLVLIADPLGRIVIQVRSHHSKEFNQPIIIHERRPDERRAASKPSLRLGFVKLTRWVVQQLYSPERLLSDLPGVQQIAVELNSYEIFRCGMRIPTACAGAVSAVPIASWQSPNHFITAIKIVNQLTQPIILDPRELRGTWRSAAFVHSKLSAQGNSGDTTVLVLISDYPFETSYF
ncbi:MAG: TIGR03749 family integrating conjugative element protein [Gammaproteobacteria bacterium]|nr:TIGR03749 family integrating conjugative element protein [Gammaproteobacteria bacterium]